MMRPSNTLTALLVSALLLFTVSCGIDEPAPVTAAPARMAVDLFGSPTIDAGSTFETVVQNLGADDALSVSDSPSGIEAAFIGSHPDRKVSVTVGAGIEAGQYPIEFLRTGPDGSQTVRWTIAVS